ncbi:hypothetical protein EJD97_021249, partial [Solanum chilense]
ESLVLGEEYLGTPNSKCEQSSTVCLKGLLELGEKRVIENVWFMGDKLAKAEYLFWSLDDGLIANGFAEGFPL